MMAPNSIRNTSHIEGVEQLGNLGSIVSADGGLRVNANPPDREMQILQQQQQVKVTSLQYLFGVAIWETTPAVSQKFGVLVNIYSYHVIRVFWPRSRGLCTGGSIPSAFFEIS